MKFTVAVFTLLICLALLSTTEGKPLRQHLRCQCVGTYSGKPIPQKIIEKLEVFPAGPHCRHEEIIVTLKRGITCVNPKDQWVIKLREMTQKNATASN